MPRRLGDGPIHQRLIQSQTTNNPKGIRMKLTAGQYWRLNIVLVILLLVSGVLLHDKIEIFEHQKETNIRCSWEGNFCDWTRERWEVLSQAGLVHKTTQAAFGNFGDGIEITIAEEDKKGLAQTSIGPYMNAGIIPFPKPRGYIFGIGCNALGTVKKESGFDKDGFLLSCSEAAFTAELYDETHSHLVFVEFKGKNSEPRLQKLLSDAHRLQGERASHDKWADYGNMLVPLAAYLLLALAALLLKGVIHFVIHGVSIGSPHYTAEELAAMEEEKERYRQKREKK